MFLSKITCSLLSLLVAFNVTTAQCVDKTEFVVKDFLHESPIRHEHRMKWWHEAKLGMFIHWGLYSIPAGKWQGQEIEGLGEWIMHDASIPTEEYQALAQDFNPDAFDAEDWVRLAKQSGMKYIVVSSKHHEGFALWDSAASDYNVVDGTPFGRDVLKELAEACAKEEIPLGFYYSIVDWHYPSGDAETFNKYLEEKMRQQLNELMTGYGPVSVIWFDGDWENLWTDELGREFYNYIRSHQSSTIINNRVGKGRDGLQGFSKAGSFAGDFQTPEQEIPENPPAGTYWESCLTINDTWGYKSSDQNWKSSSELLHHLCDIVSKGGNLLLNVGPKADGTIPAESVARLEEIGTWLKRYGEAIYGVGTSAYPQPVWGRYTQTEETVYALVFDWPKHGYLSVDIPSNNLGPVRLLTPDGTTELTIAESRGRVVVQLPEEAPETTVSVIKLMLR